MRRISFSLRILTTTLALACLPLTSALPAASFATASPAALRVCADPNALPWSNAAGEGFENALARLLAADLGRHLAYTWWPQRRGFLRNTLHAGACDVVMGVPVGLERVRTTRAWYRSGYVLVSRADGPELAGTLDDPALRRLRIGVQLVGDDGANTPPVHALARRGIVANLRGFPVYGDRGAADPSAAIVDAVAAAEVDVAVVWGPLAGYYAPRAIVPLRLTPVRPTAADAGLPMSFEIAMAVRPADAALAAELDAALARDRTAVEAILDGWGVPRLPLDRPADLAEVPR